MQKVLRSVARRGLATLSTATLNTSPGHTLRVTGACARLKIHSNMDTDLVQISTDANCELSDSAAVLLNESGDVDVRATDPTAALVIGVPSVFEMSVDADGPCEVRPQPSCAHMFCESHTSTGTCGS